MSEVHAVIYYIDRKTGEEWNRRATFLNNQVYGDYLWNNADRIKRTDVVNELWRKCAECDWWDSDPSFFTRDGDDWYCSIHKEAILCGACGLYDRAEVHQCELDDSEQEATVQNFEEQTYVCHNCDALIVATAPKIPAWIEANYPCACGANLFLIERKEVSA